MKVDPRTRRIILGRKTTTCCCSWRVRSAFVQRHNLSNQFYQEDEAGAR